MLISLSLTDLLDYTEWERNQWRTSFLEQGDSVLQVSTGANSDGRLRTVGELVRHVFAAEKRYVDRLYDRPLTDPASFGSDNTEALFRLGQQSRSELRALVATWPAEERDAMRDFKILTFAVKATPKKIVIQTMMHEIRHWAQLATLLRLNGMASGFHDFIASPVLGGEFRPA